GDAVGDRTRSFLVSLQLTDSAFPSGRYAFSAGLEAFVQAGRIDPAQPEEALTALLTDYLRYAVGPADGAALACAHRAVTDHGGGDRGRDSGGDGREGPEPAARTGERLLESVARADERLSAVKLPREARHASARSGRALLDTATAVFAVPALAAYARRVRAGCAPGNAAVLLGLLTAALGVPRRQALAGELHSFTAGSVQAAVRLAVLDHRGAQAVLHRLHPVITEVTEENTDKSVQQIAGNAPLIDVLSMRHERAALRLFAS
ncbi:urease accessory protein UreF, partial [Spinactinospora alkalitolerans]